MLIDVDNLFAKDIPIGDTPKVICLGKGGIGHNESLRFFVDITEDVAGATAVKFTLSTADDEAGTLNKTTLFVSQTIEGNALKAGIPVSIIMPSTKQKYLMMDVDTTGTATGGRYWAGLTTSIEDSWHNQ